MKIFNIIAPAMVLTAQMANGDVKKCFDLQTKEDKEILTSLCQWVPEPWPPCDKPLPSAVTCKVEREYVMGGRDEWYEKCPCCTPDGEIIRTEDENTLSIS